MCWPSQYTDSLLALISIFSSWLCSTIEKEACPIDVCPVISPLCNEIQPIIIEHDGRRCRGCSECLSYNQCPTPTCPRRIRGWVVLLYWNFEHTMWYTLKEKVLLGVNFRHSAFTKVPKFSSRIIWKYTPGTRSEYKTHLVWWACTPANKSV